MFCYRGVCAIALLSVGLMATTASRTEAAVITVGFTDVTNGASVNSYYNGGTDSAGKTGPNLGLTFIGSGTGGGIVKRDATYPNGAVQTNITINNPTGFNSGFSTDYLDVLVGFNVAVWSSVNGTGTQLFSQNYNVGGSGTIGFNFTGTAQSVTISRFSGSAYFDNITLGANVVGTPTSEVPEPSSVAALAGVGVAGLLRRRRTVPRT